MRPAIEAGPMLLDKITKSIYATTSNTVVRGVLTRCGFSVKKIHKRATVGWFPVHTGNATRELCRNSPRTLAF
jgi:hypothetical protein